jgi:hypothetical protein
VLGAAHGQQGHDVASPEPAPNSGRVRDRGSSEFHYFHFLIFKKKPAFSAGLSNLSNV